jgi:hypothetical protein
MSAEESAGPASPVKISRRAAVDALHAGIDAADDGRPVTACPHNPNGTLPEQFQALWWVKGWRRAAARAE